MELLPRRRGGRSVVEAGLMKHEDNSFTAEVGHSPGQQILGGNGSVILKHKIHDRVNQSRENTVVISQSKRFSKRVQLAYLGVTAVLS